MDEPKIRLTGLTKFDRRDLGERSGIQYEEAKLSAGEYGEVATFTVLITMALVSTAAAYLLRKHGRQSFEEEVEIVYPDGRIEHRRVRWRAESAEAPEASIIKQIQSGVPGIAL
jgi:hypothetical protein